MAEWGMKRGKMEAGQENRESFFLGDAVSVCDAETVTNHMLPLIMMIWHSAAKVFQFVSQKYFSVRATVSLNTFDKKWLYLYSLYHCNCLVICHSWICIGFLSPPKENAYFFIFLVCFVFKKALLFQKKVLPCPTSLPKNLPLSL